MQINLYEIRGKKAPMGEITDHFHNCGLRNSKKVNSRLELKYKRRF